MECYPETFKPPKRYTFSNPAKGVKVKVQVMQRVKGRRVHLPGHEEVPEIRARVMPARVAVAGRIDRSSVLGVARIGDVEPPLACEQLAVPRVARRQHAVEEIDAARYGFHDI